MKNIFFCLLFFVASCNDNQHDDAPAKAQADSMPEEKRLKDAISRFPDSLLLKENLIQYYRDSSDYENAIKEVDDALRKDSMNARLWDIKGTLHFEDADTAAAIKSFEKAVAILPGQQYIISLATLYAETKNPNALALVDGLLASKQSKAEKEVYFIKGLYYAGINEKIKAIVFFDKSLALSFTFMDAYREKAIALYDMGKYDEALAVLDKAITLQNNFDEGYYYSGKCLEKLNRIPEAIQAYKNALVFAPDYIEAKEALARLNAK